MKKTISAFLATILCLAINAQQKDFEGILVYKMDVKAKQEGTTDKFWRTMLAVGNNMTVQVKKGNYRQSSGISETWFVTKDQKIYLKFRAIDTLYYLDYGNDTSTVINISKTDEKKMIVGLECKLLTVRTGTSTKKFYYSPSLYMNPDYDKNNRIGRYDVFVKETSSIYLAYSDENELYLESETCTRLQPTAINDSAFELPRLPQKEFSQATVTKEPEFTRSGGWEKYLLKNLNTAVGAKYVRIPKGEKSATETVMVSFMVDEYGRVVNPTVLNKKEVHPKLAEEAIRVVTESPLWKPATTYGEKVSFWMKQPISFETSIK